MFDIVIPYHHKDKETLPLCIEQIHKHVIGCRHIYVLGQAHALSDVGLKCGALVVWIKEPSLQPIIYYYRQRKSAQSNRAGWLHQTLLKLQAKKYIPDLMEEYLCVDADVLFLRSVDFFQAERWFTYHQSSSHYQYRDMFERLTGLQYPRAHGFVMHHMMFRQNRVTELLEHILKYTGLQNLRRAVLKHMNVVDQSPFAECDLFGGWMLSQHEPETRPRQLRILDAAFVPSRTWLDVHENTDMDLIACHRYMRS